MTLEANNEHPVADGESVKQTLLVQSSGCSGLQAVRSPCPQNGGGGGGGGMEATGSPGGAGNAGGGETTELSIDTTGIQRFLPRCLRFAFADEDAERLYQDYYQNEKCLDFRAWFPTASLVNLAIFGGYCAFFFAGAEAGAAGPPIVTLGAVALLVLVSARSLATRRILSRRVLAALVAGAVLIQLGHMLSDLYLFSMAPRLPADALQWVLLYSFALYLLFPFRLPTTLVCAVLTAGVHVGLVIDRSAPDNGAQIGANLVLFLCVNLLGVMCYAFFEKLQRRAFLETRQSLEVKLVVEEESREQERLLLSVLPQHVASELKRDLDAAVTGPFKKIYMSRHENVSILFADIVGFTAFSSTCSAADLVRTLNELFARFDKLSEKYHQLRIKILGDCYYCISGAPEQRRDHAVLCVHMGLSMVEAIKSVREQTKSGVDMRVGIHTGAILAGVLGQRQWQFDVYSKDVVLANKMESGGLPGRVHISEATLKFLHDEFEVTNADGASREEAIRLAGIKTFFIVKVIKPYPEGTLDNPALTDRGGDHGTTKSDVSTNVVPMEASTGGGAEYRTRLQSELLARDTGAQLARSVHPLTLAFRDTDLERQYTTVNDSSNCVSLAAFPLVTLCNGIVFLILFDNSPVSYTLYAGGLVVLTVLTGLCVTPLLVKSAPKTVTAMSSAVRAKSSARFVIVLVIVLLWTVLHVATIVIAGCQTNSPDMDMSTPSGGNSSPKPTEAAWQSPVVRFPAYATQMVITGLAAVTLLTHVSYLVKLLLVSAIVLAQCLLNLTSLSASFEAFDNRAYGSNSALLSMSSNAAGGITVPPDSLGFTTSEANEGSTGAFDIAIGHGGLLSVYLVAVGVSLVICCRQLEYTTRRLFLWRREVDTQKQRVADMRQKNEALIYNILPPHVAKHFLGTRKADEELYSKSYEAVGVLFAAMPNFSDFYTEDDVNNQGLECLRFLNEVISDFDALLEQPRFRGIYKIKTIGSTYMAASGLYGSDEGAETGWEHLARLTEFALALKDTLNTINKESFNNFVLKMGINQGPITAGVIGARKPHFDIWGNTVNVASRMESTGKAGYIQVVKETKAILETFGFEFEQRGLVTVKGKGQLMTYYLIGRNSAKATAKS
ncbi:adenylate cyclase type 3-like [Varroa destructor]|uniref:adenylate cyclase n=1 Tax=Varroa destructor TaxID=109461 RepID=A0A7M7MI81_VARDE|nr:adenylate cyclase type 3-like [Varroa destructor]